MRRFRTITVAQLRDLLAGESDDALVVFTADYGDHCHTAQALPLRGEADGAVLAESGYSSSGYRLVDDDDEAEGRDVLGGPGDENRYIVIR